MLNRNLYGCCLLIACAFAFKFSIASDGPDPKKPLPVSIQINAFAEDSVSCIIPFSRAGNLIVLQARADSMTGNFILDTGAPNLILNLTYFRQYASTQHQDAEQTSVTGTGSVVLKTAIADFSIGTMNYARVESDLVNLGHIENSKGIRILGLLGMELFKQCEMIIDYDKSLIYLHRIGRKEAKNYKSEQLNDTSGYSIVPIEFIENKIVVRTEMEGKKLRFVIDSGAESNLLDSRLPNKIFENVVISGRVLLTGTGAKQLEALTGDLSHLKIGNREIGSLPVVITNLEKTCVSYSCIDGMLGFDFLTLHKLGFNFVTRKMYLWK
jgi:predicted aspartyl protease